VSTVAGFRFQTGPLPENGHSPGPDAADGDDGIHITSVTCLDRPGGPVLRVVVSWFEGGRWVERTVELPDR
jgi:hypothetical protein